MFPSDKCSGAHRSDSAQGGCSWSQTSYTRRHVKVNVCFKPSRVHFWRGICCILFRRFCGQLRSRLRHRRNYCDGQCKLTVMGSLVVRACGAARGYPEIDNILDKFQFSRLCLKCFGLKFIRFKNYFCLTDRSPNSPKPLSCYLFLRLYPRRLSSRGAKKATPSESPPSILSAGCGINRYTLLTRTIQMRKIAT